MRKTLFYFILTFLPILGFGQILQEGFNDVPALEANGWTITNQSQPVGTTSWFQGNTTVFSSHEGPANSYAGANYNNTSGNGGIISAWLITPSVNVKDGDKLSFWTRTASGSIWNDRLEVRASQGAMTLPSGAAGVGSFTNLLLVINDDLDLSYPENWTKYEIVIAGVGTTPVAMNFAFRNSLDNTSGNEGNFIGIDTLLIEEGDGGDPDPDDCDPVNVPYTQDFESAAVPAMPDCTTIENAGNGNNWTTTNTPDNEFTGTYLSYKYHDSNAANAWFYTQGINLTSGTAYKITYEYGSKAQAAFPENLKVAFGNDNTHTAMTNVLADHIGILSGATKLTNTVEFTPTTSGVFYFGFNAHSNANQWYLYVDNIHIELAGDPEPNDGCLDAPNGQYPSATFTPTCVGAPEEITSLGWTGEFSKVNLTAGTEYIFSSSIATDFVTISNEAGTEVYAAGVTPLTYTATNNEVVRFYLHLDDECNYATSGLRSRMVQCGDVPPPPAYTCEDQNVPSNDFENGLFFDAQNLAVDVIVGDNGFSVYGAELNIFVDGSTDLEFYVTFYNDAAGLPGGVFSEGFGTVHSSELIGNAFGYDIYKYTIAFDAPVSLAANTTYWMGVESDAFAWEARTGTTLGSGLVFANDSTGGDWADGSPDELVYTMICEELGVSDMSSFDFAYYPNPVKDVLNIQSQKEVKSVEAFNLTGQKVVSNTTVLLNGQINVSSLTPGTYVFRVTLEGGQVETFKIIKR
ncbi:MAG: choice-of-anchor J domain-containing protein [Weeksellaceae bacterium]